ncbi:MAG TPA: hydantoinase/oxoprolinase family protein, partial [Dehalococcoidia bacterium]|nr:hydantoinase/oxoprolinase family protein [Dehalococcoidia bacterium]
MKLTIDIDTGGTFTDGFFTFGDRVEKVKVDTTPHDLTVCFNECIEEGARMFGFNSAADLLEETEVVRLSTTLGTNTLIQRSGPKVGVIVTAGFEGNLYGSDANPLLDFLVSRDMIVGLREDTRPDGSVATLVAEDEVRMAIRKLLESGARVIVLSLRRSYENPANERRVRDIVEADYPRHYLGSVPLLLSSEVSTRPDDQSKTNVAIINAYLHRELVRYLYRAEDDLRRSRYAKPLLIVHTAGGVTRVAKTRAVDTYRSGPTAGLMGTASMSRMYGLQRVISLDVGGTSTDVGQVLNGNWTYSFDSEMAGVPVGLPTIEVRSVAGGGGSIARVDSEKRTITVGPQSAGARPGPACYGLGNEEPTVTDACIALGYIDPDYYHGGRRKLNSDLAKHALEKLAKQAGASMEEAAFDIVKGLEHIAVDAAQRLVESARHGANDLALFSFGGGGGLICGAVADRVGASKIYSFPFSSVFSAFGSSIMNVVHCYERLARVAIQRPGVAAPERVPLLDRLIAQMAEAAYRDMRGEGFLPEQITFSIEAELSLEGTSHCALVCLATGSLQGDSLASMCSDFMGQLGHPREKSPGNIMLDVLRLKAQCPTRHYVTATFEPLGENPEAAFKGTRLA